MCLNYRDLNKANPKDDYRDLNKASPKVDFPLLHIHALIENTVGLAVFSFMDGFSGYNQISIALKGRASIIVFTHWGTYKAMPFGLKNTGGIYE